VFCAAMTGITACQLRSLPLMPDDLGAGIVTSLYAFGEFGMAYVAVDVAC